MAAIKAAVDSARAELDAIVAEKRRAESALAKAQADSEKVLAAMAAQQAAYVRANAASAVRSATPSTQGLKEVLPTASKIKPLLPNGTHAFLSYQWDVQGQVIHIKELLNQRNVKCWMDIDGGMKSDIYDSMAEGVQGAACVICFMTQAYQDSANCKLELKFAQQSGVPIIPVMMEPNFSAKGWLGILTSGSIWTPMHDRASVPEGINKLIELAQHLVPGMHGVDDGSDVASEVSENTESFDVGAWGANMFSLDEMREELERLREESDSGGRRSTFANEAGSSLCSPPAMVPTLPHGLFVTAEMQTVLNAVLSDEPPPQIGFCGMGGIGKTTVSCWVTRSDAVRTKFGIVAWITLGQTPALHACFDLLHLQLANAPMPEGVSFDQKHELLKQAFLHQSVLLILDDCWDEEVAKHFDWIDRSTNSKVLISSRVREVLNGGQIVNVNVPSQSDAVNMLLSTAGLDSSALKGRAEVGKVADLCKRLPLTIGVAGKLIRQLAQGSSMTSASDWTDVVALLEEELEEKEGSLLSIEESIIRASIKAIPTKLRGNVSQLFISFALAPEDTLEPLPVLGMLFSSSSSMPTNSSSSSSSSRPAKPLSRLQVRRYLKVLIDRSLVLGTVDRPQLHDVMLDYVQKELTGEAYKAAQRRLVELLRKSDRSSATPTGKYTQSCVRHHIKESHTAAWEKSPQALCWLDDHVSGVQDAVASSAASILPAEVLAKEAEAAGTWWQAALRWKALGRMKAEEAGNFNSGTEYVKKAVNASAKVIIVELNSSQEIGDAAVAQFNLDIFDVGGLNHILKSWVPKDTAAYGERYQKVLATKAGRSQPLLAYGATMSIEWFPAILSGSEQAYADSNWTLSKMILDLCDETADAYALATEEDRATAKPLLAWTLVLAGDAIVNAPGFHWDCLGHAGDVLIEHDNAYVFEVHHARFKDIISYDPYASPGAPWILTLEYGPIEEARTMIDRNLIIAEKTLATQDPITAGMMVCLAPELFHMHGLSQHIQKVMEFDGITFENAAEKSAERFAPLLGTVVASMEHTGPGGGIFSQKRIVWHIKVMLILHTDVPTPKAVAWLESLPDNDGFYATTMTFPTHMHLYAMYRTCWIALAHEKSGLYDGALRFADLQLEPDMLKAGLPLTKWPQVIAWACKGRVLAKLDRPDEALVAFQAAIAVSKESYSLMAAFAYRELANFRAGGGAAVQASKDLEAKLDSFDGRLTRAAFDGLTIGPGEFKG